GDLLLGGPVTQLVLVAGLHDVADVLEFAGGLAHCVATLDVAPGPFGLLHQFVDGRLVVLGVAAQLGKEAAGAPADSVVAGDGVEDLGELESGVPAAERAPGGSFLGRRDPPGWT